MVRKMLNLGHSWLLVINNLREQLSEETVFNLFLFIAAALESQPGKQSWKGFYSI